MTTTGEMIHTTDEVIWRWSHWISDTVTFQMPRGAKVLHVDRKRSDDSSDEFSLWALVDPTREWVGRRIHIIGTGNPVPQAALGCRHIGTWQDGDAAWHAFLSPHEYIEEGSDG